MRDRWAVLLAAATMTGAWVARPLPLATGAAIVALALPLRRPVLLCLGACVLASSLGARAWAGVSHPRPARDVMGVATLTDDPRWDHGAVRATMRLGGKRWDAWVRGSDRAAVSNLLAGERLVVSGRTGGLSPTAAQRLAPKHVVGRLTVRTVGRTGTGAPPYALANALRRVLARGSSALSERDQALFAGFVLGDGRDEDPRDVDAFRASGLSHLLVVSGENVAFVLALAGPLLRRGPYPLRLVLGLAVLGLFGVMTRWEPSVLRAEAMAAIAMLAAARGRPASTIRVLSLAVALLVLVDPLLVHALGFELSVAACAGIALLRAPIEQCLRGPAPVRATLAVTLAAQAGVAPLLVTTFGAVPLVSIPANLLAVPAAGPLMVWGLTAGFISGAVGGPMRAVLALPTRLLITWIAGVAHVATSLHAPQLGQPALLGIAAVACIALAPRLFGMVLARRAG